MEQIIQFVKDNALYCIIGVAVLVVLIVIIVLCSKKKSKALEVEPEEATQSTVEISQPTVETSEAKTVEIEPVVEVEPVVEAEVVETAEAPIMVAETKPAKKASVKATTKPVTKKVEPKIDTEARTKYSGKWVLEQKGDREYIFTLRASNGELLCESEAYTTLAGAKRGIETFKRNLVNGSMKLDEDKRGRFRFKIYGTNNKLLFVGENYDTKERALSSYNSVKRFAETAYIVDCTKTELDDK